MAEEATQSNAATQTDQNRITTVRIEKDLAEQYRDLILQVIAVATAVIFGTWSVLSWDVAKQANAQSRQANALAFAAFCGQLSANVSVLRALDTTLGREFDYRDTGFHGPAVQRSQRRSTGYRHSSRDVALRHTYGH